MAEHQSMLPPSFKLERELTLMPSEFQERLSAKHRSQKSAHSTASTRAQHRQSSSKSRKSKGSLCLTTENSNLSGLYEYDYNGNPDTLHGHQSFNNMSPRIGNNTPVSDAMDTKMEDFQSPELNSTSAHIKLNHETKFMFDNAYSNRESEGGLFVQTPPQDLHIRDLMIPLNEWGSHETIREKKYTVLPSISKSPGSDTESYKYTEASETLANNQLDFTRDKIEQDADFFADFRVNTSHIKPTPRQDPLPPIKHETAPDIIKIPSATMQRQNSQITTKMKLRKKDKARLM